MTMRKAVWTEHNIRSRVRTRDFNRGNTTNTLPFSTRLEMYMQVATPIMHDNSIAGTPSRSTIVLREAHDLRLAAR
jgi:hypothetical protein